MNAVDWLRAFEKEQKTIREISRKAGATELEVIKALVTGERVALHGKDLVLPLLADLAELKSPCMLIVENQGSIFEIKCNFPKGAPGHGYYNLKMSDNGGLGGHLNINEIGCVAVTAEIFFGIPSKSWWFMHESGKVMFKVFVGRKANKEFWEDQLALFEKWLCKQI